MQSKFLKETFKNIYRFCGFAILLISIFFCWYTNFESTWVFIGWSTTVIAVAIPQLLWAYSLVKGSDQIEIDNGLFFWSCSVNVSTLLTLVLPGREEEPFMMEIYSLIAGAIIISSSIWYIVGYRWIDHFQRPKSKLIVLSLAMTVALCALIISAKALNYVHLWDAMTHKPEALQPSKDEPYQRFILGRFDARGSLIIIYELAGEQIEYLVVYERYANAVYEKEIAINHGSFQTSNFIKDVLFQKPICSENKNKDNVLGFPTAFAFLYTNDKAISLEEIPDNLKGFNTSLYNQRNDAVRICLKGCNEKPLSKCEENHLRKIRFFFEIANLRIWPASFALSDLDVIPFVNTSEKLASDE
jgi:hypothetical protein